MLTSQIAQREPDGRQGRPRVDLAELRRQLARPSTMDDGHRQRLLEFVQKLARVRALGGEYARVDLSEFASVAVMQNVAMM